MVRQSSLRMQHPFRALDFAPFTFRGVHASMPQLPLQSPPRQVHRQASPRYPTDKSCRHFRLWQRSSGKLLLLLQCTCRSPMQAVALMPIACGSYMFLLHVPAASMLSCRGLVRQRQRSQHRWHRCTVQCFKRSCDVCALAVLPLADADTWLVCALPSKS